jgi:hypothetical protein
MNRRNFILPAILVGWGVGISLIAVVDMDWIQMTFNRSNWVKETCSKWAAKLITDQDMTQRFQLPNAFQAENQVRTSLGAAVLLCQAHGSLIH